MADESVVIRTINITKLVAGYIQSYLHECKPEVGYWIGKNFWEKGIATHTLSDFYLL